MRTLLFILLMLLVQLASGQGQRHFYPTPPTDSLDAMMILVASMGYQPADLMIRQVKEALIFHNDTGSVGVNEMITKYYLNDQDVDQQAVRLSTLMNYYGIIAIVSEQVYDCQWCTLFLLNGESSTAYLRNEDRCDLDDPCPFQRKPKVLRKISAELSLIKWDESMINSFRSN